MQSGFSLLQVIVSLLSSLSFLWMHRNMNCADTGLIYRMYVRIFPFHGFLLATALVWFTERCGTVNINKKDK